MTDDLEKEARIQAIRKELELRETEDLLAIWEAHDRREWSAEAFSALQSILLERLVSLPPQENRQPATAALDDAQRVEDARQSLGEADYWLDEGDGKRALQASQEAIHSAPHFADAYNHQGLAYDVLGHLEEAIASYREALRLDPGFEEARQNLGEAQRELNQIEWDPQVDRHLEQAIARVEEDELVGALAECDLAISISPGYAPGHNYKGMILEELERYEEAIAEYRSAVELDPEFYAARENLCSARLFWRDEQYRRIAQGDYVVLEEPMVYPSVGDEEDEVSLDEIPYQRSEDLEPYDPEAPAYYLDARSMLLRGWPGNRTRPGRSGYDYLDNNFECGAMGGIVLRSLFTARFRTYNLIYLLMMLILGAYFFMSGLIISFLGIVSWNLNDLTFLPSMVQNIILGILLFASGLALVGNVVISLFTWNFEGRGSMTGVD